LHLQARFDGHQRVLNELTEIGDSVTRMDQLIEEVSGFQSDCSEDLVRTLEVIAKGRSIIESNEKYSSKDTVEPKCNELMRITELFNERLHRRMELLTKARSLLERVEMANEWCAKGIDLLASQRIENVSVPPETAEVKLHEIVAFVESAEDFQLTSLKDFKNFFEESTSLETIIVSQVSCLLLRDI